MIRSSVHIVLVFYECIRIFSLVAPSGGLQPCAAACVQAWNHPRVRAADRFPGRIGRRFPLKQRSREKVLFLMLLMMQKTTKNKVLVIIDELNFEITGDLQV